MWTEDQTDLAVRMSNQLCSASEIATEIGKTRNAVIAKFSREGVKLARLPGGKWREDWTENAL